METKASLEIRRREVSALKAEKAKAGTAVDDDDDKDEGPWNSKGILLDGLLQILQKKLIVQHLQQLMQHLQELIDHKVVSVSRTQLKGRSSSSSSMDNSTDFITVMLATNVLQMLVAPKQQPSTVATAGGASMV